MGCNLLFRTEWSVGKRAVCLYLAAVDKFYQHIPSVGSSRLAAFLSAISSAALFLLSWPALVGLPIFALFAFVPLFYISQLAISRKITHNELKWFTAAAFLTWNVGAVSFLFSLEASLGIRMLSMFTPVVINTLWMTAAMMLYHWSAQRAGVGWGSVLFVAVWLSFEFIELHWPLAFPWLNLGHVFATQPEWVQWYSITGVAGGSLFVLLLNVMISLGILHLSSKTARGIALALIILLIAIPVAYRQLDSTQQTESAQKLTFTIVQPCAGVGKQTEEYRGVAFRLAEARQLFYDQQLAGSIVVFPETYLFEKPVISGPADSLAFSGLWIDKLNGSKSVEILREMMARGQWKGVIAGAFTQRFYDRDDSAPGFAVAVPGLGASVVNYNSALLLDSAKVEIRHKTMLVPGVEVVPFASSLPFLNDMALNLGGVVGTLGQNPKIETVEVSDHQIGVQICYDSAFGWVSRELVNRGAEVLVVITNDSWWDDTPGYKHLLQFAQLRAIEFGRPVVRSANCGVSAFINSRGEIVEHIPWDEKGAITAQVDVGRGMTFYTSYGDFIYIGSVAVALLALLAVGFYAHRISDR